MPRSFERDNDNKKKVDFFSFFPVPDFLSMRTLGLDISDESLKLVELITKNNQTHVGFYASEAIPEGVLKGGHVLNHAGLVEVVADIQRRHRFTFVDASLPEQELYLYTTSLPSGTQEFLRETIEFHIEENIPLSKTETVFDFEVFKEYKKEGKKYVDVAVSAIHAAVSESYISLLKKSGLRPMSLTTEADAIARAVIRRGDKNVYIIIDVGALRTGISLVSEGVTQLTSTVETGGRHITETLSSLLSLSFEDAEERKRETGILLHDDILDERMIKQLTSITRNVSEQIRFWNSRAGKNEKVKTISKVFLVGGGALTKGLEGFIEKNLNIPTELGSVWENVAFPVHYVPEITFEESLSFATAIGLSLKK